MEKINWDNVPVEQVNPQMKRKFVHGEHIMIAQMEFEDGFLVPWHSHHNEQITSVIEGTIRFCFDDVEDTYTDLNAGDVIVIVPVVTAHVGWVVVIVGAGGDGS